MEQVKLGLAVHSRRNGDSIATEDILRRDTMTKAIIFSFDVAGLPDNTVCAELEIDAATYSKIKSGTRHFPPDKLIQAMELAGNDIPLRWLAHKRGFGLVRLQSEIERENEDLKRQLAEQSKKFEHFTEFLTIAKQ